MLSSFSIILPVADASRGADDADYSIATESDVPAQYVVVASEPRPADLAPLVTGSRSVLIERSGISETEAINLGLQHSEGSIVGWLRAGCSHLDHTLKAAARYFRQHPDTDVVCGDALWLDQRGKVLGEFRTRNVTRARLERGCCLFEAAVFLRRRVIDRHGLLDPRWQYWSDYEYWLRLHRAGVRFGRLPRLLATCRVPGEPSHLGVMPRERTSEGLAELNDLLHHTLGRVPTRWIVQFGRVAAKERSAQDSRPPNQSHSPWHLSLTAHRHWNADPWWSPRMWLDLPARFLVSYWRTLLRRPDVIRAVAPQFAAKFADRYLKRRIFKLRNHDPRPLRIPPSYAHARPPLNPPLISIVTPNLNQGAFLEATLRSVLDQDYPRLEYIVQDGGSSDHSVEVIHRYAPRLKRWASESDQGQADAINRGMQHASGDILAYLNSDDLLMPGSLAYIARYFAEHPSVDIVYGHRVLIDEQGDEIGRWVLPPHDESVLPLADYIPQETMFWRRSAWERVGARLDETFQFAMDWDLILRFRAAGLKFVRLPRFIGAFRISDSQKTQSLLATVGRLEFDKCRERALGRVPSEREVRRAIRPYLRRHWWFDKLYLAGLIRY
ncbi:MAG TPA: glycosyltransferase [Pirellulaceae bacterium]|nr:glycosyltransferase [Pirellulaceae bacterium]